MLEVQFEGKRAIIDVREQAIRKEHPGDKVLEYIKKSPIETVFEIHVPHKANPLVKKLEAIGMNVSTNRVSDDHYYLVAANNQVFP